MLFVDFPYILLVDFNYTHPSPWFTSAAFVFVNNMKLVYNLWPYFTITFTVLLGKVEICFGFGLCHCGGK